MQKPVNRQTAIVQVLFLHHGKTAGTVKGYLHTLVGCGDWTIFDSDWVRERSCICFIDKMWCVMV